MRKPIATAIFHDGFSTVSIKRSSAAAAGPDGATFHAPGWRALAFRTVDAAKAKMERHPGFQGWVA